MVKKARAKTRNKKAPSRAQKQGRLTALENEQIEQVPAPIFVERAYLDYAMTVILNRALPVLGDGLKPVQRRIVYAMSELGLSAQSKPKKSARTVGDVIGKFHPHGDSACYEAMVLMAQPFSYRYPLIDGHGNWGSTDDPKSFAAMRYTESRLTPYAKTLTEELEQGTTSWRPNFDNTLKEPTCLPAKLPNMLLNGASGIAVGMSTDIPPHNLREVLGACIALLDRARLSDDELFAMIPGPDFPGGGVICSEAQTIQEAYTSGNGNIRLRAEYEIIDGDIVITSMPYQVSTLRVVEQIATQIRNKKLPFVRNLRDESTEDDPVRLVIKPKGGKVSAEDLMSHLFATTDLERLCRINLNVIDQSGRPSVMSLKKMLQAWLAFRTETVTSRLSWRLERIKERLEELAGFLIAYAHIDEVIRVIRESDDPQPELMKRFKLNERQAHAILELKLRRLAKLEYLKVKDEQAALQKEKKELDAILNSKARLKTLIKKELKACIEAHGDDRRTQITAEANGATALKLEDLSSAEAVSVIVSRNGWVRAVKGHDIDAHGLSYQSGDEFLSMARTTSKSRVVFFDAGGQCFCAAVASLPSGKGYGEPLSSRFALSAAVVAMAGDDGDELLLVSSVGNALRVRREALNNTTRNGKKVVNLAEGVTLAVVTTVPKDSLTVAVSNSGRMLAVRAEELPVLARGKGVRLIKINADEALADTVCIGANQTLLVDAGAKKRFSYDEIAENYAARRGTRGKLLPPRHRKNVRLTVEGNTA